MQNWTKIEFIQWARPLASLSAQAQIRCFSPQLRGINVSSACLVLYLWLVCADCGFQTWPLKRGSTSPLMKLSESQHPCRLIYFCFDVLQSLVFKVVLYLCADKLKEEPTESVSVRCRASTRTQDSFRAPWHWSSKSLNSTGGMHLMITVIID